MNAPRELLARAAAALRRVLARWLPGPSLEVRTRRAADALAAALAEDDADRRLVLLRAALAEGEALAGPAGDITVMEASLHLGEKLRALGNRDEAMAMFARAIERSYRVGDPVGRQRRAGVLTRLGILDQEAGNAEGARHRYEEALRLGADTDSGLLLGMLTQAAFNLGLLQTDKGDETAAVGSWERAMSLGVRAGHPSGWDPAAVAAFNLGHLHVRRGDLALARRAFGQVCSLGEPAGTPLGLMAAAKAELALASLAESEGLPGEADASRHHERAVTLGRASHMPDGALAAVQAAFALGEAAIGAGRHGDAVRHFRAALDAADAAAAEDVVRHVVLAELRLGQVLAETGAHAEAAEHLASAFAIGRRREDDGSREVAAQAACTLHRVHCALGRWNDAAALADEAEGFARTIDSPDGRAMTAAVGYARAWQLVHAGDEAAARERLGRVAEAAFASACEAGDRVGIDALLLAGHLARKAQLHDEALRRFRELGARLGERRAPEHDGLAALAAANEGHCHLALDRRADARRAYERALERGRTSGSGNGRAAAANAALNLASMLEDELPEERRRALYASAIALGRSSAMPLGEQCAVTATRALEALDSGD